MIIECNVWCTGRNKYEIDLGLPEGDSWLPFAIDFSSIVAIKECGENDFLGKGKATVYFASEVVTIDISFIDAIKKWKECKL